MDDQQNPQLFTNLMLNAVDNVMRYLDINVPRHFRVDRCHAPARPVVVDNQIMGSYNSFIGSNLFHDLRIQIRIRSLPDQRFQCIFCNGNTGPHNEYRHNKSCDCVDINRKEMADQYRSDRCARRDHVAHGIRRRCQHHLRLNAVSQFSVEKRHPQLYTNREHQNQKRNHLKCDLFRIADFLQGAL